MPQQSIAHKLEILREKLDHDLLYLEEFDCSNPIRLRDLIKSSLLVQKEIIIHLENLWRG